jgi:2-polyprenyl-3-methyl-5-hydroxy-6-metoxy-1,4-benzoquinol methylase
MKTLSLKIIALENPNSSTPQTQRSQHTVETQAKWERLWLHESERFNPKRKATEKIRLKRIWHSICQEDSLKGAKVCDLASGWGTLSLQASDGGAEVTAVDVASGALTRVNTIESKERACLPHTKLPDQKYDIVLACDILAELPRRDHRLFISELHRLCKPEGKIIFSTAVDIESFDALTKLQSLLQTDLEIEKWKVSHLTYFIRIIKLLKAPKRLATGQLKARSRIGKFFCKWSKTSPFSAGWNVIATLLAPLLKFLEKSENLALLLEKIAKILQSESSITHVIVTAKRRKTFDEGKTNKWKKAGDCLKAQEETLKAATFQS